MAVSVALEDGLQGHHRRLVDGQPGSADVHPALRDVGHIIMAHPGHDAALHPALALPEEVDALPLQAGVAEPTPSERDGEREIDGDQGFPRGRLPE